jgi:hypothetical protein
VLLLPSEEAMFSNIGSDTEALNGVTEPVEAYGGMVHVELMRLSHKSIPPLHYHFHISSDSV